MGTPTYNPHCNEDLINDPKAVKGNKKVQILSVILQSYNYAPNNSKCYLMFSYVTCVFVIALSWNEATLLFKLEIR